MTIAGIGELTARQRKIIRAWCMYDWANSAFATSGTVAIFPFYFVFLFKEAMGESASFLGITFTGSSMWSLGVAVSTAIVAISSPVIGVIADRVPNQESAPLDIHHCGFAVYRACVLLSLHFAALDLALRDVLPCQHRVCGRPRVLQRLPSSHRASQSAG